MPKDVDLSQFETTSGEVDLSQFEGAPGEVDLSQFEAPQKKPWYSIPSIGEALKGWERGQVDERAMRGFRESLPLPPEMKRRMEEPTGAIGSMLPVVGNLYEEFAKLGDIPQRLILEGLTGRLGRYPTFGELQEELKQTSLANDERNALAQKMGPPESGRAAPNVSIAMPGISNVTQYPDYMGERFMRDSRYDTEQQKALRRDVSPAVDPALYAADFARRQAPNQLFFDTAGAVANPVKAAEMLGIGKALKWIEGLPRPIGFGTAKPRVPAPAPAMKNEPLPQGVYGISPGEMERIKAWKMSPDAAPDETITALERQWGENQKAATLGKPPLEDALLEQRKAALPEAYRKSEAILDEEPIALSGKPAPASVPRDTLTQRDIFAQPRETLPINEAAMGAKPLAPEAPPAPVAAAGELKPFPGESDIDFMIRTGGIPIQNAQGGLGFIQPAREFKAKIAKWYRESMDVLNANLSVGIGKLTAPARAKVDPLVGAALNRLGTDPVKFNAAYNDWFVQQGLNVPPGLKDVILLNELQEEAANKIAWDFYDTMKKVPKADREIIYEIMTHPDLMKQAAISNNPRIQQLGKIAYDQRQTVIQSGIEQVDLGLLSPETFSAYYGKYLPRLFERSQFGEQAGAKYPSTARKHIITDPYNMRKDAYIVTYKENGVPRFKKFGDNEALRDTQYKAMLKQKGITNLEKVDPIPPDVLIDLGQIKDVQYTLTRQKMVSAQNIAYARIYKFVDKMGEEWTLPGEIPGKSIAPGAAGRAGQLVDYAYKKLPASKRLGIMSGRWAKNEVYEELFRIDKSLSGGMQFGGDSTMGQIFNWYNRNLLGPWKAGKVLFDSAVYSGNILSTYVMYDTGGGKLTSIGKAIDILIKAKKGNLDPHYVNGKAAGVFRQNFALNDLMELKTVYLDQEKGFNVAKAASKLANMAAQKAGKFYGAIDDTFRFAMFLQESENGASPAEALRIAQYWTIPYRDAAKAVKLMQTMPLANTPFLTFYYYAIPRMLKAHLGLGPKGFDPMIALRFAKYPIIFKMVDFYNKKRLGILDKEDKLLPFLNPFRTPTPREEAIKTSWLKKDKTVSKVANAASDFWGLNPLVGAKTTMIDGKPTTEYQKLALARLTPVGNIAQFPIPFISDPIMKTIYEEKLNKSGFTGQPIRKPHGEYQHFIPEVNYAAQVLLPTWMFPIPGVTKGGYSMEKTIAALTGKQDYFGRKRDILPVAFDVILGIKQQPVIPKVEIKFELQEIAKNIQQIDNERNNIPETMRGRPEQDILDRKAELKADKDKWVARRRNLKKVKAEMDILDRERIREWKMTPEQRKAPSPRSLLTPEKAKAMLA